MRQTLIVLGGVATIIVLASLALSFVPRSPRTPPAVAESSTPNDPGSTPTAQRDSVSLPFPVTKTTNGQWSDDVSRDDLLRIQVAAQFTAIMTERDHSLPYPGTRQADAPAISAAQARKLAADLPLPSEEDFAATPAYSIALDVVAAFVNDDHVVRLNAVTTDQLGTRLETSVVIETEPCPGNATGYCVTGYADDTEGTP